MSNVSSEVLKVGEVLATYWRYSRSGQRWGGTGDTHGRGSIIEVLEVLDSRSGEHWGGTGGTDGWAALGRYWRYPRSGHY